jgi:hypothetical protein
LNSCIINIFFLQSFLLLHQFSTFSPNPVFGNIAVHQKYLSKIFYYGNWSSISFNYIDNRDLLKDKTNVHMFMENNLKKTYKFNSENWLFCYAVLLIIVIVFLPCFQVSDTLFPFLSSRSVVSASNKLNAIHLLHLLNKDHQQHFMQKNVFDSI